MRGFKPVLEPDFLAWAQSDPAFSAQVDNPVYAMTVQPNGRIAMGGQFTSLDGAPRNYLGRLNGDGSLDAGFNPGANDKVYTSVVLTNGQILVGGSFTNLAGQPRSHLGRLNPDGTLDATFNPGADGDVYSLLLQGDGKLVVAGSFANLAGQLRDSIGRLKADGLPDTTFSASASNVIYTLAMQPDRKILAGGAFLGFNGVATNYICRLNTNGGPDTSFAASADNEVHALAVQADGKILAGGLFLYIDGEFHNDLARLNADGTVDTSFTASVRPGYLGDTDTIVVQSDGKILAGGTAIGWFGFPYFARFNGDGTVDTNFTANIPSGVHSIAIQRDGKILQRHVFHPGTADQCTGHRGADLIPTPPLPGCAAGAARKCGARRLKAPRTSPTGSVSAQPHASREGGSARAFPPPSMPISGRAASLPAATTTPRKATSRRTPGRSWS